MTLVLYDNPVSSNALKVRFLLSELGLAYERREVPLSRPRPGWYVAVNPVAGIPALADAGLVLAESHAILRYLAARERRDDLYPAALADRARVDEFLDRWALTLRPAFYRVEAPALGAFGAPADPAAAAAAEAEIQPQLALAEQLVGDRAVVLDRLTIADFAIAPVLFRTTKTGLDLSGHPKLTALREALLAHPAWPGAEAVT